MIKTCAAQLKAVRIWICDPTQHWNYHPPKRIIFQPAFFKMVIDVSIRGWDYGYVKYINIFPTTICLAESFVFQNTSSSVQVSWILWRASSSPLFLPKKSFRYQRNSITLPETNNSHLKIGHPKRKLVFQPSIFRCYVSFREGKLKFGQTRDILYLKKEMIDGCLRYFSPHILYGVF